MMFQKKFMGRVVAAAVAVLVTGILGTVVYHRFTSPQMQIQSAHLFVMDTECTIALVDGEPNAVAPCLYRLDTELDCYDPQSPLYALNQGNALPLDTDAAQLVLDAVSLQEQYAGKVDVTTGALTMLWGITTEHPQVPAPDAISAARRTIGVSHLHTNTQSQMLWLDAGTAVDGGAVAKGYALDVVAALLDAQGVTCGTVSMTSSMLLYGEKPDGSPFSVAVRNPDGDGILGTILTDACFVSTSGGYERFFVAEDGTSYCHILDPDTGYPVKTDLASVTVLCDSGMLSDYLSTLIYMGGTAALAPHLQQDAYQVLAVDCDGRTYASDGIQFVPEQ